ncbi:sialic acid-binding Ig-like lectin 7 isoform X2 [Poecilia reticulata]|uniref:sialic acid-binding Ig-like lectin 7 isoform X2 n=1 Tax=Poecilia reticulata TaxID=8081 RepID=UPI0004A39427|nr:PREDICTED: sialic acid-binding Ig-like lectin 7 isoform X2 [Poecilia reticulata]
MGIKLLDNSFEIVRYAPRLPSTFISENNQYLFIFMEVDKTLSTLSTCEVIAPSGAHAGHFRSLQFTLEIIYESQGGGYQSNQKLSARPLVVCNCGTDAAGLIRQLHLFPVNELMEGYKRVMAALSENLLTVSMLLCVFFLPGVQTACHSTHKGINISAPRHLASLSGSCLLIPCSFTDNKTMKFDGRRKTFGIWIKTSTLIGAYPQNTVYNSSWSKSKYGINIIGSLSEKNCTTVFSHMIQSNTGRYFFQVESGLFRSIATCDPVQITVNDSAWSPRIEISGVMKEKNSVTVTCSALTPCPYSPPELTLNLQPNPHRQMERNTDGTFTTTIQQNITLSEIHDGHNIICFARYPVAGGKHKTANAEVTLSVFSAPKNTSAWITLAKGKWVELRCSSRANPPVSIFTWFENTTNGAVKSGEGENYGVQVTEEKTYYCVATNDVGSQTSPEIHLTLPTIEIELSNEVLGRQGIDSSKVQIPILTGLGVMMLVCLLAIIIWFHKKRSGTP